MIIYVNPMWSMQTINSDSNYVFLTEVIRKFIDKYPNYYFIMPFPVSTGFRYYDDGFFRSQNVLRIPIKLPQGKRQNNMHFDSNFVSKIYENFGVFVVWNQIPEIAPQLKYLLSNYQLQPSIINQHHYIIHKTLPYPIQTDLHFIYMHLIGDHLANVNVFNSEYCWKMTLDNIREYLPNLEDSISKKKLILKFGFFDDTYKMGNVEKYDKFTFLFNHRFQSYKNWRTTFELFDELHKEYDFQVLVTKAGGDKINVINGKPYVIIKDLPTRKQYFEEIQKCHCNTFNSQHETFCISLLDSMHFGLSVMVPNKTTMPELLGKDNWQIFNSVEEQKEKIIQLIKNKDLLEKHGQANIKQANQFNVTDYVEELKKVFDKEMPTHLFDSMREHNQENLIKKIGNKKELKPEELKKMRSEMNLASQSMPLFKMNVILHNLGWEQIIKDNSSFWIK